MTTKLVVLFAILGIYLNGATSLQDVFFHTATEATQAIWSPFNRVLDPAYGVYRYFYFFEYNISHHITSPTGTTISAEVIVLDVPNNSGDDDRLLIYDGDTTASTLIFLGTAPNASVSLESTGNSLLVLFISDDDRNNYNFGFLLTYWMKGSVSSNEQGESKTGLKAVSITMSVFATLFLILNIVLGCLLYRTHKRNDRIMSQPGSQSANDVENGNSRVNEGRTGIGSHTVTVTVPAVSVIPERHASWSRPLQRSALFQ